MRNGGGFPATAEHDCLCGCKKGHPLFDLMYLQKWVQAGPLLCGFEDTAFLRSNTDEDRSVVLAIALLWSIKSDWRNMGQNRGFAARLRLNHSTSCAIGVIKLLDFQ